MFKTNSKFYVTCCWEIEACFVLDTPETCLTIFGTFSYLCYHETMPLSEILVLEDEWSCYQWRPRLITTSDFLLGQMWPKCSFTLPLTKWCILIALNNKKKKKSEFSIPVLWVHLLFLPLNVQETKLIIQTEFCLLRTFTTRLTKLLLASLSLLSWFSSTCQLLF